MIKPDQSSKQINPDRRDFVKTSAALAAAPLILKNPLSATTYRANDRGVLGCIGTGSRWGAVGPAAANFADCVAVCDVDKNHAENAAKRMEDQQEKRPEIFEDYQKILENDEIDVVTIVTPDHWHTKMSIEAMRAGKDVYCEKPLTLTIEEGQQICQVVKETGQVFQVGTQQRSEMGLRFLQAIALIRDGRIGDIRQIHVAIGGAPTSPAIPVTEVPAHINWDKWLGQAPMVDFRDNGKNRRSHYEFRWWYEYSGGKMTDWGAHHVDIAQWGLDQLGEGQGPVSIEPVEVEHPTTMVNGMPTESDRYNTATKFNVKVMFGNGAQMNIRNDCKDLGFDNGIRFEGTKGRFLVNRGKIVGKPVEDLAESPLPEGLMQEVYGGREPGNHMKNFFDCIKVREQPISDVFTHHKAMTTCHLANIAIRLNRTLNWDPKSEQIVDDPAAAKWVGREQRKGYEIEV